MTDDQLATAYAEHEARFAPTPAALSDIKAAVRRRRRARTATISAGAAVCAVAVIAGASIAANTFGDSSAPPGPAGTSSADPTGTPTRPATEPPQGDQNSIWQQEIQPYKREIVATARQHESFLGGSLKFEDRALILYGETPTAPADVAALIAAAPDAVTVSWVQAEFTMKQLEAARQDLMAQLPDVVSVAIAPDFSALKVGVLPETLQADRPALEAQAAQITSVPVVLTGTRFPVPG
jgi:hypothetical protein